MSVTAAELLHESGFDEAAFEQAPAEPNERGADWALAAPFFAAVVATYGVIGVVLYSVIA